MIFDLLLNTRNLVSEVMFAPGMVTSHIQIEPVDVGEGRNGNRTASNKNQWPQQFEGKTAEKIIKKLANPDIFKTIRNLGNFWNCKFCFGVDTDAEEDNKCEY